MRLSKTTHHAIRILIAGARAGDALLKVAEISDQLGITEQNTFKIVHLLSRAGLVAAVRGRNGGVKLARPANQIRIGDVVMAMERMDANSSGGRKTSGVNDLLDHALDAFVAVLNQHTLADMAREGRTPLSAPALKAGAARASRPQKARAARRTSARASGTGRPLG